MKSSISALATALLVVGSTAVAASPYSSSMGPVDTAPVVVADSLWVADYDEAMRLAKESGKDILLDFTGSDWCGWCIRLDNEVFSKSEFVDAAPKDFVLCKLDYPNGAEAKAKVPNPARNNEVRDMFEIRGYPTILLLTNEGEVLGQTGYRAGGPEKYLTHLAELRTNGKAAITKVRELVESFEKAPDDKKVAALERVLAAYSEMHETAPAKRLVPIVEQALALDADNSKGLQVKAMRLLLESGAATERIVAAAEARDPKNEDGLLELCVAHAFDSVSDDVSARAAVARLEALIATNTFKDKAAIGRLCFHAAYWCYEPLADQAKAVVLAKKALELGVDDELRPMLEQILGEESTDDAGEEEGDEGRTNK